MNLLYNKCAFLQTIILYLLLNTYFLIRTDGCSAFACLACLNGHGKSRGAHELLGVARPFGEKIPALERAKYCKK
jgi:hypothetical protein